MKKLLVFCFIVIVLSGCLTTGVGSYKVKHEKYEDIENPFTVDSVLIYKDILYNISMQKITSKIEYFTFEIVYEGSSWSFIDGNVLIDANGKIFKYNDKKPHRMVLNNGNVRERISVVIPDIDIQEIVNANILRIQFFADPIIIDDNGKNYIKQFYEEYK